MNHGQIFYLALSLSLPLKLCVPTKRTYSVTITRESNKYFWLDNWMVSLAMGVEKKSTNNAFTVSAVSTMLYFVLNILEDVSSLL